MVPLSQTFCEIFFSSNSGCYHLVIKNRTEVDFRVSYLRCYGVLYFIFWFLPFSWWQAGLFFLRHADAVEKEIPARELHEMLLFALQWLSGYITQIPP